MSFIGLNDLLHARLLAGQDGAPSPATVPDARCEVVPSSASESGRPALTGRALVELLREVAEQDESDDLSTCPYWARYENLPDHDPEASCDRGCYDEPECVTCTPSDGWPSQKCRAVCLAAADILAGLPDA